MSDHKQTASGRLIRPPRWLTALAVSSSDFELSSYDEAMSCQDKTLWERAIDEECHSLVETGTFKKVTVLLLGKKAIGSKFVFKLKKKDRKSVV